MSEHVVTNADQVDLILQAGDSKKGTAQDMGRIVVDDFSVTKDEDDTLESGIGQRLPAGVSFGDVEFNFSFTMLGDDVDVFKMIANADGISKTFSFTALKQEDGDTQWEVALDTCVTTSEEWSASSGDTMEYSVEGIAVSMDNTF